MLKHIYLALALAAPTLFYTPAFAQDAPVETSLEFGVSYSDSVTLKDSGSTLNLDDVKTLDVGVRAERELARRENLSLSGALSGQARFGEGNASELNGLTQTGEADYRRLEGYADLIARIEGEEDTDWTPFLSLGAGVVEDRVKLDNQVYKDLSPAGRFRAGVEKKVSDKVTFGIGAGPSVKLD